MYYEIPHKPWEVIGANIFMANNKTLLCIADYYSKFLILKKVGSLSAMICYKWPRYFLMNMDSLKVVSDAGTNFTSEMFKKFCSAMNTEQSITSSYR